jgi:type IV secretion system protein VirB10
LARHPDLDPSLQGHNKAFLTRQQVTGYLPFQQQAPLSRFELKTGTVIPAVLVTGVNSDLPGQLIGQVSQDVYDTATGNHRLIPQGAKLIGNYSSRVALGQERVLVAWHRIVFPDASTLELATMPGADQAGYAGFHDRVNNHYWRLFGNALLLSVITAGIQLSQPQTSDGDRGFSAQQQIAGALGLQMGQVGAEMVRRNMQIQPTLEIRPGYRFNVMVNQDILFTRPWQG